MFPPSSLFHNSHNHDTSSFKNFWFVIPSTLALLTSLFILVYVYYTSIIFTIHHQPHYHSLQPILHFKSPSSPTLLNNDSEFIKSHSFKLDDHGLQSQRGLSPQNSSKESNLHANAITHVSRKFEENSNVFHDKDIFMEDYKEMNRSFKIYVYPHKKDDPFANVLLPIKSEPSGNYASESYFKKALMKSHFITKDPTQADLFFMPFSIASLRHDPRVGVGGIKDFIRDYVRNINQNYPYWNRTGGADHFYVACHSVGRTAMEKVPDVKFKAIQVVCSSSYFLTGYIAHKDACLPQIWPRNDINNNSSKSNLVSSIRKKLAFFAGAGNSPLRRIVVEKWKNDSEIFVHHGRLKTPYADELLGSKFCLHVKGYEVNTARVGDSLYYGCVPVIIADYYDLPFVDVLNWKSFSVVVTTLDIPYLKKILKGIVSSGEYLKLKRNVLKVREQFQWHSPPLDFDVFYMVMYELWLRRSSIPILLEES